MPTALITLVQVPACHFCADAQDALSKLQREYPMKVDVIPADSQAGRALVGAYRPALFPLVLVDGAFLSAGRLPRHKLRALLDTRVPAGGP